MYSIESKYDKKNADTYIGMVYKTDGKNGVDNTYPIKYITCRENGKHENMEFSEEYNIIPLLHETNPDNLKKRVNIQRSVYYIYASSGSGKSFLVNQIASMYYYLQRKQIYFVSNNDVKADSSLTHAIYNFITLNQWIDKFRTDGSIDAWSEGKNKDYDDSLIIFDDISFDNKDKENKRIFQDVMNIILKHKRKNNLSCIITSHEMYARNSLYPTSIFTELTGYFFFGSTDLRNRNNSILRTQYRLTEDEIHLILSLKSRWVGILTKNKTIISQHDIIKLK